LGFLLVLRQLCLVFGFSTKNFEYFFLIRSKKQNPFYVFYFLLLQLGSFSKTRILSFFYLFGVVQGFLKVFKIEFFHMKSFFKKITQNLKKKSRFSSRVFLNGRSRFGFLSNNFSKKRGFVLKSKKKSLYFRKLENYMHRFAVF